MYCNFNGPLTLLYYFLYLSAPVGADGAHDTDTLLWKMSVSKPLCFCGLHATMASLFHSFFPRLWFIHTFHGNISFIFTLNDTCWMHFNTLMSSSSMDLVFRPTTTLPILPLDCSWTYLLCHYPTLPSFKIHLLPSKWKVLLGIPEK